MDAYHSDFKQVLKEELVDECDYIREAGFAARFRNNSHLDSRFRIPWVWKGSTKEVLVMEYIEGESVGGSSIDHSTQVDRNEVWVLTSTPQILIVSLR